MAVVFTMTTLTGSPSQAFASLGVTDLTRGVKAQTGLRQDLYAMPTELGSLVTLWEPSAGTNSGERRAENISRSLSPVLRDDPFVVLIQDAHANPEAQKNIATMLQYLEAKSPDLTVGLEGAAGALHPEYLNFFKEFPEANQAVVEDLKQKGELTGAEIFLLEKYRGTGTPQGLDTKRSDGERETNSFDVKRSTFHAPKAYGVETPALYRDNLKTYRDLLFKRDEMQTLLNPVRANLEKESSQKLNGELRDFLKERSRRKEGNFGAQTTAQGDPNLHAYIRYLQKQVLKLLEVDLKDPIEQLRFPSLLRVVMLEEARKGFDPEKVKSQWEEAIRSVKSAAKDSGEKDFAEALSAFGREKGFIPAGEGKAFVASAPRSLFPRKLLEGLFLFAQKHKLSFTGREAFWQSWKLAVFQAEIDVTELLQEMDALEEGLIQKLARSEEEKALVQKLGNFDLLEKLLRLEVSRPEYEKALARSEALNVFVKDSANLRKALDKAYYFYEVSLKRDRALIDNALSLSVRRTPYAVQVLITGGFHTPGIEEILRQKGIGYAVFTPRITKVDHGEMYQNVMSDANADLSAYFKVKNPFRTKQEAILFKELIEIATPALSEKYQGTGAEIAGRVQKAAEENPVLSRVVMTQTSAQDPASLRFTPKPAGELLPQNAAIPGIPVTSSLAYSEEVTTPSPLIDGAVPAVVTFTVARALQIDTKQESVLQEKGTAKIGDLNVSVGTLTGGRAVPQTSRSEARNPAAAGDMKREVLPGSALDIANAFRDRVYITGNLPAG
ncbi:MAG: hypothetical protein WCJ71_08480, partial [Candidatus Omnitrophota bacterium]